MTREFDAPWKECLDRYLRELLQILIPPLYACIDPDLPYESLDAELQQVVREGEFGPTYADRLFRVPLRGGGELYLLIHVEVQAQVDPTFPERMFRYSCRLRDRYNHDVESVAILADESATWRPTEYLHQTLTTWTRFAFTAVKLLDWAGQVEALLEHPSPVGLVIVAHLQSHATKGDLDRRLAWKFRLARLLRHRGLESQAIREVFRLIDWLLELPAEVDRKLYQDLLTYDEESRMPVMGSYERMLREMFREEALAEGREEGRVEARVEVLLRLLAQRFGPEAEGLAGELRQRPAAEWVDRLEGQLLVAPSLEALCAAVG